MAANPDEVLYDVVIVGAGLTGLVAAQRCLAKGKSVLVLEARERVGGRTETFEVPNIHGEPGSFDHGARFVASYQEDVWQLIQELKLVPFKQYEGEEDPQFNANPPWARLGANLLHDGINELAHYIGPILPKTASDQYYFKYLNKLIDDFPTHDPTRMENAKALDQLSVEEWVEQLDLPGNGPPSPKFRALIGLLCRVGLSEEPDRISMLWLLFYIASSGGLDRFQSVRFPQEGAQSHRVTTGAASISETLCKKVKDEGGTVLLDVCVDEIHDDTGAQTVTVTSGTRAFRGHKVLVALSPSLYSHCIAFQPPLAPARLKAAKAMSTPPMIVATVTFSKAFWRDKKEAQKGRFFGDETGDIARFGYSGDVLSTHAPVVWMMDASSSLEQPALFAFIVGDSARELARTEAGRREAVLNHMKRAFGEDLVGSHDPNYFERNWTNEQFSAGGPAAHFSKGEFFESGQQILLNGNANPHGNVYFASSETATIFNGYMSGAVWSGKRVAHEICGANADEKLDVTARVREEAMRWCIRTILRAIERQEPALELPALSPHIKFFGPGGKTLLRGPFSGKRHTADFYRLLAKYFTLTGVNIDAISVDVKANTGFASFSVAGMVNESGNPFRDVKATMVFDFNDDAGSTDRVVVTRDWLFMDVQQIDALAAAPAGPFSLKKSNEHKFREVAEKFALLKDDAFDRVTVRFSDGSDEGTRHPALKPLVGHRAIAQRIHARFNGKKLKVIATKFDPAGRTYYSWQEAEGNEGANGVRQMLLVTVRFANEPEPVVSEVEFQS